MVSWGTVPWQTGDRRSGAWRGAIGVSAGNGSTAHGVTESVVGVCKQRMHGSWGGWISGESTGPWGVLPYTHTVLAPLGRGHFVPLSTALHHFTYALAKYSIHLDEFVPGGWASHRQSCVAPWGHGVTARWGLWEATGCFGATGRSSCGTVGPDGARGEPWAPWGHGFVAHGGWVPTAVRVSMECGAIGAWGQRQTADVPFAAPVLMPPTLQAAPWPRRFAASARPSAPLPTTTWQRQTSSRQVPGSVLLLQERCRDWGACLKVDAHEHVWSRGVRRQRNAGVGRWGTGRDPGPV